MAKRKPEAELVEEEELEEVDEEEEIEEVEEEVEVEEEEEEEEEEEVEDEEEEEVEEEEEEEEEEEDAEPEAGERAASGGRKGKASEAEEVEEETSSREAIRKLLEPFGKDQLIEFLKEAAARNPSVIQKISDSAESDPIHRKLFVHGLGWDATNEAVAATFRPYGEIEECNVVMDKATGKSKGFGFVLFRTRAGAQNALKQPQKKIGNRMTSCQLASFGPVNDAGARKIYVSNVGPDVNPVLLRAFFERFGEIEESQLGQDQATGKLKGYALFTYKTVEGCRKALEEPLKVFEGCQLQCRKAFENLKAKVPTAVGGAGTSGLLQPNDLALMYASPSLMGLVGQNLTPAAALVGHNPGVGSLNPAVAALVGHNPGVAALNPAAAALPPSVSRIGTTPTSLYGAASAVGVGASGVNSISPSVIGNYSHAAFQGLGYQGVHLPSATDMRSHSGLGPFSRTSLGR